MSKKISTILIISGVALLLVACGLFTYNRIFDYRAGLRAQELLDGMMADFEWDLPPLEEMVYTPQAAASEPVEQKDTQPVTILPAIERPALDVDSVEFDGADDENAEPIVSSSSWVPPTYTTLGILSIPKLNTRLPVIGECTDTLLKISCCRISGLANEKPYRLVIVGHNIWSHFKGLDTFQEGDQVAFTTMSGETYYYSAVETKILHKAEGAEVLVSEGWDLALITCRTDNTMRTVVYFAEMTE